MVTLKPVFLTLNPCSWELCRVVLSKVSMPPKPISHHLNMCTHTYPLPLPVISLESSLPAICSFLALPAPHGHHCKTQSGLN